MSVSESLSRSEPGNGAEPAPSASAKGVRSEGFDPDELRRKYREERDRRVRSDGNDQYLEVAGDLAGYVEDPYIDHAIERP